MGFFTIISDKKYWQEILQCWLLLSSFQFPLQLFILFSWDFNEVIEVFIIVKLKKQNLLKYQYKEKWVRTWKMFRQADNIYSLLISPFGRSSILFTPTCTIHWIKYNQSPYRDKKERQDASRKLFSITPTIFVHLANKSILKYSLNFCIIFYNDVLIYLNVNFINTCRNVLF